MRDGMAATEVDGPDRLEVDGDQDILWEIVGGRRELRIKFEVHAVLVAEDGSADGTGDAVSAWVTGQKVGNLGHDDARRLRSGLIRLQQEHKRAIALPGLIVGGGPRRERLGLRLTYDAKAFGVT